MRGSATACGSVRTATPRHARRGMSMRVCLVSLLLLIPTSAVAQTANVPRTAWGVPDLSGYWEYRTTTPLQRPEALADKIVLTPEEAAAYLAQRHAAIGRERDLQLNADWWEPGGLAHGRTSLIVDPADGRIPSLTAAAQHRVQTLAPPFRSRAANGPEDRERYERCIMGRTVPLLAVAPNRLAQIFQTPDHVAILHEQNSDLRIIPARRWVAPRGADSSVARALTRALGRRHARRRDEQLQWALDVPRGGSEHATRRAVPCRRREHAAL